MRHLIGSWLLAPALLSAQTLVPDPVEVGDSALAPAIVDPRDLVAVDPLDSEFDPNDPRYRGLVPEELRPPRPLPAVFRQPLGEAFSAREGETGIDLTLGEEPALGETLGVRVNRLAVAPAVVELTAGESFTLEELDVKAYGTTGKLVEHAPLRLELEGPEGFVDLEAFSADGRTLQALGRGIGRVWVTSTLPALLTENFSVPVVLIVREPGSRRSRLSSKRYENVPASPP